MQRRTRQQKIAAQTRRESQPHLTYQYTSEAHAPSTKVSGAASRASTLHSFFGYDTALIFKDLKKTVLITSLILVVLLIITWYIK